MELQESNNNCSETQTVVSIDLNATTTEDVVSGPVAVPSSAGSAGDSGYDGSGSDEGSSALSTFGSSYQSSLSSLGSSNRKCERRPYHQQSYSINGTGNVFIEGMDSITSERTSPSLSSNSSNSRCKVKVKPRCAVWQGSMQVLRQTVPLSASLAQSQHQSGSIMESPRISSDLLNYRRDDDLIYALTHEMMTHIMTYLGPPHIIHKVLIYPFSKSWRANYTQNADLWRSLCVSEPFGALLGHSKRGLGHRGSRSQDVVAKSSKKRSYASSRSSSSGSINSCSSSSSSDDDSSNFNQKTRSVRQIYGRYRLMHTSFVGCLKYLHKIKNDSAIAARSRRGSSLTTSNVEDVMVGYLCFRIIVVVYY